MDISLSTAAAPAARSPLTRRSLLRASLTGALLWTARPYSSVAASLLSSRAATASQTLLPWTDLTLDLIKDTRPSPPRAARILALVHIAIAEAARNASPATP